MSQLKSKLTQEHVRPMGVPSEANDRLKRAMGDFAEMEVRNSFWRGIQIGILAGALFMLLLHVALGI